MDTANGTVNFWSIRRHIDLDIRRTELEALIAPHVSQKKTAIVIHFRGKQSYLKSGFEYCRETLALQLLYNLEAALKSGDTDRAIQMAMLFGEYDFICRNKEMFGIDPVEASAKAMLGKTTRRNTRLGKTDLKDVKDILLESIVGNHKGSRKRNWLLLATNEINQKCNTSVDAVTVRREMKRRGIWDKSTKVRAASKS